MNSGLWLWTNNALDFAHVHWLYSIPCFFVYSVVHVFGLLPKNLLVGSDGFRYISVSIPPWSPLCFSRLNLPQVDAIYEHARLHFVFVAVTRLGHFDGRRGR